MFKQEPTITVVRPVLSPSPGAFERTLAHTPPFGFTPAPGHAVVPTMPYPTCTATTGDCRIWNTGTKPTRPKERWM